MISTPQYERDVVSCNVEFPNVYLNCLRDLACDRRNKNHFEVLNLICRVSCHLDRVLRSDWSLGRCLRNPCCLSVKYIIMITTFHNVATQDVLKHLTTYGRKRDGH